MNNNELWNIGVPGKLGELPKKMHAWVICKDKHAAPSESFTQEVVDLPEIGDNDVLVYVMAAGINYNGVWAALGKPVSVFSFVKDDFFITGSDLSGIVWAVGKNVKNCKVGDEVVAHCNQTDKYDIECNGGDPMLSKSQKIWGYETNYGSFAQFSRLQSSQVLKKPLHLSWADSSGYVLCLATAYRMLFGHAPHNVAPGKTVLVWGGGGGLGSYAIQLCKLVGAKPIAVVSSDEKAEYVKKLGAYDVIDRRNYSCFGVLPEQDSLEYRAWSRASIKFKRDLTRITGDKRGVDIVVEHPGRDTFPLSTFVVSPGGMVVFCAATTGYNFTFDARYVWMGNKRIQGTHFAHDKQSFEANELVRDGKIEPCISEAFSWENLPQAHQLMYDNSHPPGNMVIKVGASKESRQIDSRDISCL